MTSDDAYKATIAGMQAEIHNLQLRIKQLSEENNELKQQIKENNSK
tara:strand:+ start:659 stop:796 length:138 start_codon:yes stop_codon:yes gene_type:complete